MGGTFPCGVCGSPIAENARFCAACGVPAGSKPVPCVKCGLPFAPTLPACPKCATPLLTRDVPTVIKPNDPPAVPSGSPQAPVAPPPAPPPPVPPAPPTPTEPGRDHSPALATLVSVVPGGGQAYNGQPFKALAFFLFAPLVLPWIWAFIDAFLVARRIVSQGGRYGRGGFPWIFIQSWLAFNATLFILIVLTLCGVIR